MLSGAVAGLTMGQSLWIQSAYGAAIGVTADVAGQLITSKEACVSAAFKNLDVESIVIAGVAGGFGAGAGKLMEAGGATLVDAAITAGSIAGGIELGLRINLRDARDGKIALPKGIYLN